MKSPHFSPLFPPPFVTQTKEAGDTQRYQKDGPKAEDTGGTQRYQESHPKEDTKTQNSGNVPKGTSRPRTVVVRTMTDDRSKRWPVELQEAWKDDSSTVPAVRHSTMTQGGLCLQYSTATMIVYISWTVFVHRDSPSLSHNTQTQPEQSPSDSRT